MVALKAANLIGIICCTRQRNDTLSQKFFISLTHPPTYAITHMQVLLAQWQDGSWEARGLLQPPMPGGRNINKQSATNSRGGRLRSANRYVKFQLADSSESHAAAG